MANTSEVVPAMSRRILVSILVPVAFLLLAVAVPSVVRAGGGCHGPVSPPGDGEASVIKIDGCMFYPTVARVPVGTTVRFLNTGQVPHNVTGVSGTWGSPGEFEPNAEYRATFSTAGIYPFACTLHPGMNGAIVVGDAAAAAAAAPGAVTTDSQPTAAPAAPEAPTGAAVTDWIPIAIAAVGGFALGALGSAMAAGAVRVRRGDARLPTTR
jgi:plastocyanin